MKSLDDVLSGTDTDNANGEADKDTTQPAHDAEQDAATGDISQVAAGNDNADSDDTASPAKIKAELAALAKERERVRRKEAELDEERKRFASSQDDSDKQTATVTTTDASTRDLKAELKTVRREYARALMDQQLDPDDEAATKAVDELEDKMEAIREAIDERKTSQKAIQDRSISEFNSTLADVQKEYPFLTLTGDKYQKELHEDIDAYYYGRLNQGDSPAVALRKAVNKFCPSHAEKMGGTKKQESESVRQSGVSSELSKALQQSGFSETRSAGRSSEKRFSGMTPMDSILGKT